MKLQVYRVRWDNPSAPDLLPSYHVRLVADNGVVLMQSKREGYKRKASAMKMARSVQDEAGYDRFTVDHTFPIEDLTGEAP